MLCATTLGAYAVSYEVYKPAYKSAYSGSAVQVGATMPSCTMRSTSSTYMSTTCRISNDQITFGSASGRFSTYVPDVDETSGQSYSPGRSNAPGGPRRVQGDDEDDERETEDPFYDKVVPLGDTPWFIMLLLSLSYIAFRLFRKKRVE